MKVEGGRMKVFSIMREHHDTINRLSIDLDYDAQRFTVYAARLENRLKAVPIQKLDFTDLKCWVYDVDGVMGKRLKAKG